MRSKVLWVRVGDRRQETGDRRNGNERGGRSKNCPKIVLPNYEPKIRSMQEREELKTRHCNSTPKRLKPLSVNTFRFNQQAPIRTIRGSPTGERRSPTNVEMRILKIIGSRDPTLIGKMFLEACSNPHYKNNF
ncbi:hypothetical protein [Okeania hirsuta]|uniref:hypothetical protein n=1 Tax=Okeania hirsuta TaxID=1458930 RepID=UPI000F522AEF|nr:hypothetical protein [Okeania hirsuta]